MHQRTIAGASKTGSISRLQARAAAKAVKMANSKSGTGIKSVPKRKTGQFVSASVIERYLGHFGFGPSKNVGTAPRTKVNRKEDAA